MENRSKNLRNVGRWKISISKAIIKIKKNPKKYIMIDSVGRTLGEIVFHKCQSGIYLDLPPRIQRLSKFTVPVKLSLDFY